MARAKGQSGAKAIDGDGRDIQCFGHQCDTCFRGAGFNHKAAKIWRFCEQRTQMGWTCILIIGV
jgi:hypothetical protein